MASTLLLIPLDDTVVFPTMDVTLPVDPGDEDQVLLVPRHEREYRATVEEILEERGDDGRIANWLRAIAEPGALADTAGYAPDLTFEQKVRLLETTDVTERLELALGLQRQRLAQLHVRPRIREDVEEGAAKQQREYVLRKQMESIRRELGEDDGSFVDEYRAKIEEAGMPEAVREQAERELGRLERMGESSAESSMIRTYLDWLIAVPWSKRSADRLDPNHTREVLDADHAGLEDVKDRIVEYVAVKKLREERGIEPDKKSGAILTLIGPPGTGKTSIGESIARAMGREFVRMSLGGVRDEAEIRGHYLDVELDLSQVVFIVTANTAETIPGPLLDRMEVIPFDGYTTAEKVAIAEGYLWPRQRDRNGLRDDEVAIDDVLLETIVTEYTREAGVRQLERELGKLLRKTATKIVAGEREAPVVVDDAFVREALGRQR